MNGHNPDELRLDARLRLADLHGIQTKVFRKLAVFLILVVLIAVVLVR